MKRFSYRKPWGGRRLCIAIVPSHLSPAKVMAGLLRARTMAGAIVVGVCRGSVIQDSSWYDPATTTPQALRQATRWGATPLVHRRLCRPARNRPIPPAPMVFASLRDGLPGTPGRERLHQSRRERAGRDTLAHSRLVVADVDRPAIVDAGEPLQSHLPDRFGAWLGLGQVHSVGHISPATPTCPHQSWPTRPSSPGRESRSRSP